MLKKNNFIKFIVNNYKYYGIISNVLDKYVEFHALIVDKDVICNITVDSAQLTDCSELNVDEYIFVTKCLNSRKKLWCGNKLITHGFNEGDIVVKKDSNYAMIFSFEKPYYKDAFNIVTGEYPMILEVDVQDLRHANYEEASRYKTIKEAYEKGINNVDYNINIQEDDFDRLIHDIDIHLFIPKKYKLYNPFEKKLPCLGEIIHVRNSETEEWVTKFFACKDKTSSGEVVIKTTDGKSWKLYK
jgi:hypothetical protein